MKFHYGNVYLRIAGHVMGLVASGVFLYYALLADSVRSGPISQLSREEVIFEVIPFLGFILFLLLTTLGVLSQTDTMVDDEGISRKLWGRTWQAVRWDNARLITSEPIVGKGTSLQLFRIFPKDKPKIQLLLLATVGVTDRIDNAAELISLLNHYAQKHDIKIEVRETMYSSLKEVARL